jgi:RNA binding exosome subunit
MKKTNNYYGTYMRVLQETKKTSGYYGNYMRVLQEML